LAKRGPIVDDLDEPAQPRIGLVAIGAAFHQSLIAFLAD